MATIGATIFAIRSDDCDVDNVGAGIEAEEIAVAEELHV